MNAILDAEILAERDNDAADSEWARKEAAYRDEAVADVAAGYVLNEADWGEPTANLTDDEGRQFAKALAFGDSDTIGSLYMAGLDRMRERFMASVFGEQAIQERIYELVEENE